MPYDYQIGRKIKDKNIWKKPPFCIASKYMENKADISTDCLRFDGRKPDELRKISFTPNIAPNATGSVLAVFGNTQVICAATVEKKVPSWMNAQAATKGWMSAEYSMLPYATLTRKQRPVSAGKQDGRSVEIQRLIGRSMRAVADLDKLAGHTLWIDCDVLQADGGTRTASINGAFVAAKIAVAKLIAAGEIQEDPFTDSVAAISVGMFGGRPVLDLPYLEDRDADVDANVVMTGSEKFVEVQMSGEEAVFDGDELAKLLSLAKKGIGEITKLQQQTIRKALDE